MTKKSVLRRASGLPDKGGRGAFFIARLYTLVTYAVFGMMLGIVLGMAIGDTFLNAW